MLADAGLVLLGAVIGFVSAWGLEKLRECRERKRRIALLKRELRVLMEESGRLLADYEDYAPVGKFPKNHSFAWGGPPTLRLLRSVSLAYQGDRDRLALPTRKRTAEDLFHFALLLEAVSEKLERHLATRSMDPLPEPRIRDTDFQELRKRAGRLLKEL